MATSTTTSIPAPGASDIVTYGVTPQGFIVKPFQAILNDAFARAQLLFGPDIDLRSTSSIRKLIELTCLDAGLLWMALDDVYHSGFTSTAVGGALDLLGADLGLQRARTKAGGQATFKLQPSAPPGSVLTLPLGTLVDSGGATPVSFRLGATVTLSNDPTQPYPPSANAAVTAVASGPVGNIPANSVVQINPTFAARYLNFNPSFVAVSNTLAFTGGEGFQADDDYRHSLQAVPRTLWTADAIRAAVTGLDGVRDALVSDPYGGLDEPAPSFGAACFGDMLFQLPRDVCSPYFFSIVVAAKPGVLWVTQGTAPNQIIGLRDQILAALQSVRPISSFPTLVQADSVEVAVRGQITLSPGADADTVLAAARMALTAYIATLRLGDGVFYAQVLRVLTELPGVADVQNLRLRAAPPRYGETVFGPPATFGDPTDIAAFEAPCGGNLTLASTQVAVFDAHSALTDLQAS
jgi:uncharacterized phage protein gp47/JayE